MRYMTVEAGRRGGAAVAVGTLGLPLLSVLVEGSGAARAGAALWALGALTGPVSLSRASLVFSAPEAAVFLIIDSVTVLL